MTTCGFIAFGAVRVRFLKRHHFSPFSAKIGRKGHEFQQIVSSRSFLFNLCLGNAKTPILIQTVSLFPKSVRISLIAKFRDLLTFDDVMVY